jgi:phage tail sheath protein FI
MDDSAAQGGTSGPTVAAYRKALDIVGTKSEVDIQLLAIPGINHSSVTNYAIDTAESRFDALYIMDIEERDALNVIITGSIGTVNAHVQNTVLGFKSRNLNTSFAATYFPNVKVAVEDTSTDGTPDVVTTNADVPASVTVLGAFAKNDSVAHPWFAAAGFTRGALDEAVAPSTFLNQANQDLLYDADINPIVQFPGQALMVFGQKTLLKSDSALDRVNVRRLLLYIRREVRAIANEMLFEPNRSSTLARFTSLVNPILQNVQAGQGVERFKVIIDSSTTTQSDIENNTVRGKIFLQPTRSVEFVSLDFVLTNAGDAFDSA